MRARGRHYSLWRRFGLLGEVAEACARTTAEHTMESESAHRGLRFYFRKFKLDTTLGSRLPVAGWVQKLTDDPQHFLGTVS
jgi:hypothetical protein